MFAVGPSHNHNDSSTDVLVIPSRVVPRLADLNSTELSALMSAVQHVGQVIERVYGADGLTIACQVSQTPSSRLVNCSHKDIIQDGKAAGQTVPHVHFHLLPRKLHKDRFATRNDEIYPALEHAEGTLPTDLRAAARNSESVTPEGDASSGFVEGVDPIKMDADEERKPRSMEEMLQEAEWLRTFFGEQPKN